MAAAVVVLVLLFVDPPAAGAHEITVAVVVSISADGSEVDARAVLDGLHLAIGASPDVGHAPGPGAGDHLGGVDVQVIDLGSVREAVVGASVRAAVTEGATLVVVVGEAEAVAAAAEVVLPESAFTIAVLTRTDDADVSFPGAVLRVSPTVNADAVGAMSEAFETAYGRELSESAGIGYDVGQLLDVLLAETDGAPPDAAALDKVRATAQARLTLTTFGSVDETPPTTAETPPGASDNTDRSSIPWRLLVGLGVAVVGILTFRIHRRRPKRIR